MRTRATDFFDTVTRRPLYSFQVYSDELERWMHVCDGRLIVAFKSPLDRSELRKAVSRTRRRREMCEAIKHFLKTHPRQRAEMPKLQGR